MFYNAKWTKHYESLRDYLMQHGGKCPPPNYKDADDFGLGSFAKDLHREFQTKNNEPQTNLIKALPRNNWG